MQRRLRSRPGAPTTKAQCGQAGIGGRGRTTAWVQRRVHDPDGQAASHCRGRTQGRTQDKNVTVSNVLPPFHKVRRIKLVKGQTLLNWTKYIRKS
jgi:hypothetical protein